MHYDPGDLVLLELGSTVKSVGVVLSFKKIKETKTLDDLWLTKIYDEYVLYNILVQGKIKTLTNNQIIKRLL